MAEDNNIEDKKTEIVVDETPIEQEETVVEAAEAEETAEDGIETLKERLRLEKEARQKAEMAQAQYEKTAKQAETDKQHTNLQLIGNALESYKQNAAVLRSRYAEALRDGAYDQAAELQEAIAENTTRIQKLQDGYSALEERIKAPVEPMPKTNDPVEAFAARLSPRSANWIRQHPQCVTDQRLNMKMIGFHNVAVAEGYEPDSDDYFEFIEQRLGIRQPVKQKVEAEEEQVMSAAAAPKTKRSSPPPAPSSSVSSGNTRSSKVVRLTDEQQEIARMSGLTNEEYARNLVNLRREGKIVN
jgi:hypothetical protein